MARALFIEPLDREPSAHVYCDTHVPWLDVNDALPKKAPQAPPEPQGSGG